MDLHEFRIARFLARFKICVIRGSSVVRKFCLPASIHMIRNEIQKNNLNPNMFEPEFVFINNFLIWFKRWLKYEWNSFGVCVASFSNFMNLEKGWEKYFIRMSWGTWFQSSKLNICTQSHYIEVTKGGIFMEQKKWFGLVLSQLAILEKNWGRLQIFLFV